MSVITKDLGIASAYGYAKSKGYTGTEEEFAELMASYADVAQQAEAAAQDAEDAKDAAITAKTAAQTAQTAAQAAQSAAETASGTASAKASEAAQSAQSAAGSASAAQTSATAAAGSAQTAQAAAQTATTKASEASSSASAASTAKTGAETARTGAQTAQTAAETAQANAEAAASSVSASAAQIEQNTEEIGAIKNDFNDLKSAISKFRHIEPVRINGVEFTGNLITYNSYSVSGKFVDVLNGKIRWNNGAYNTYVIPIETGKQYSFNSTTWWAITDENGLILDSCGSTGIQKNSYDTTALSGAAYFFVSISTSTTPVFRITGDSSSESSAEIPWLKVTETNIHDLNLLSADDAILPSQLKGATNLGDLIQYYGSEIVTGKFVYGVAGSSVQFANNAEYKYSVVPVVPDMVYKFPAVSWWALTDENDIVLYGCGNNGTRVSSIDTSGYPTAAKLYVTFLSSATAYIIDKDTNTTEYSWTLDGFASQANNNVFSIPNFKHITGKAWNLFFSGGWLRNAEYKRTNTGSAQYNDRFVYLTTTPGIANHTIRIYDNNFDPIGVNVERMTYVNPDYRNLTALFIGDSTINDGRLTEKVLEVFVTNNVTCTLLGTTGSGNNKREGRSGWSAADYCGLTTRGQDTAQNPFYNPSTQTFDFSYYMTQQGYSDPDFVFIQLGINDMFSVSMAGFDSGYSTFKANMLTIINSIHAYSASIKIVVNLITMPNGNISAFNTLYGANYYNWERRYVDIRANNKLISDLPSYVLLNPHNLILDPMTNIRDDVHPTADGYAVLGEFDANYMFAN